jgi:dTDP-4-dehydrorhamnose reductase
MVAWRPPPNVSRRVSAGDRRPFDVAGYACAVERDGQAHRDRRRARARGTLGRAFARACEVRGLAFVALGRDALDVTHEDSCAATLAALGAWSVINCAGFVRVDDAERERVACHASNTTGAAVLARVCGAAGVKLISFSSDLVFDGRKRSPYVESDRVAPLCEYGRSKALAEVMVLDACPSAMVVRTAAFFGDDDASFVTAALRALAMAEPFVATDDVVVSPTYVPDLVEAVLDLAIDGECGIWHLANAGALTWHALAAEAARVAGVRADALVAAPLAERPVTARRPMYSVLGSERSSIMPTLDNALARYARARSWENGGRPTTSVAAAADDDPNDSQMRSAMSGAVR